MNREELIAELQKRYPEMTFRTTEEFNGTEGGIWTSAEDGQLHAGLPLFDYYTQDGGEKNYIFGVHKFLHNWLEENDWYCEFNDPGTVMIWEI